jgi:hypothetical protein
MRYETGMRSRRSHRYGGVTSAASGYERYYFTRRQTPGFA